MQPCSRCGVDIETWGRMHVCRPRVDPEPAAKATDTPTPGSPTNPAVANKVANDDVANSAHMANQERSPGRNRSSSTYRYRHPDKRRDYMAAYMRTYRKRANEKATPAA